ncbi:MAG: Na/Pi cotransporter family protein [Pseudohongiellaceae bacterium]
MNYFEIFYTVIGGLGIFFLGLTYLSESLQSSGRDAIRQILGKATSNRGLAVLAGIGITAFVQSSSIATVMTVSLVNAGLMELRQALGVILGANIGTTVTGWIISIKVGDYGLLFVGLGILPMMLSSVALIRALGKTAMALGLIFIGLEFMSDAFRPLRTDENFISYLYLFDAQSLPSLLACIAMGCLLTIIVQSSSAMLGITFTLASTGVINFDTAVGLIIGENIGTTITAQIASIGANTSAVRAARGHAIFNVLGACLMVMIFPFYVYLVDFLVAGEANFRDSAGEHPNIAFHIAVAHTVFNIVNVLLWVPFIDYLTALVKWLVPQSDTQETYSLKFLGNPKMQSVEISLQEAELELGNLEEITLKLLSETREYITAVKHRKKLFRRIEHLEEVTDHIENEMINFITLVQTSELTKEQSMRAYGYVRMADEIESLADSLKAMALYRSRLFDKKDHVTQAAWDDLIGFYDEVESYFKRIVEARKNHASEAIVGKLIRESGHLNLWADEVRSRHLQRLSEGECQTVPAQAFNDIAIMLRRVKSHSVNYLEAYDLD